MKSGSWEKFWTEFKVHASDYFLCVKRVCSRHRLLLFVVFPSLAVAGACALFPIDVGISDGFSHAKRDHRLCYDIMKKVSKYGDFAGAAGCCAALVVAGKLFGRRRLILAGVIGFAASSAAGLFNDVIKFTGRPRPDARIEYKLEDRFYGPKFNKRHLPDHHYQSFPSGHTATAFGAAAGIGLICPAFAIPAFAGASLVAFSRVYILDHYPSDVFVAALIGAWFGLVFALAARDMMKTPVQLQ